MKKTAIFILLYSLLWGARVSGLRAGLRDVWLLDPHHSWFTYAKNNSGQVGHVSRQFSNGQHANLASVSGRSFTVHSGGASHCLNCTSSGGKTKHRSKFIFDVHNAPDSEGVRKAMNKVAVIMGRAWSSKITVNVRVAFGDLGASNVLVNGGGTYFCKIHSLNQVVPIAAGESILGKDLNQHIKGAGKYDVIITMNTNTPWYYGTDGRTTNDKFDLVTVLLHEMYHNLIFTGGIRVDVQKLNGSVQQKAKLNNAHISRFDSFLANKEGCAVLGYLKDKALKEKTKKSGDVLLGDALTNEQLYFGSGKDGDLVRLFAPRVFDSNSSIYHLDTKKSSDESIMTAHEFEKGRAQHAIGSRILKIQKLYLDAGLKGANTNCPRPLQDPKKRPLNAEERKDVPTAEQTTAPVSSAFSPDFYHHRSRKAIGWVIGLSVFGAMLALILCGIIGCVLWRMKNDREDDSSSTLSSLSDTLQKTQPPFQRRNGGYDRRFKPEITPTYSMLESFRGAAGHNAHRECGKLPETILTSTRKPSSTVPSSMVPPTLTSISTPTPISVAPPTPNSVAPPSIPPRCKKIPCRPAPTKKKPPRPKPCTTRPPVSIYVSSTGYNRIQ